MRLNRTSALLWLLVSVLSSCAYNKVNPNQSASINCISADSIRFNKNIIPILTQNCSTSGCHTGNSPSGNLNLDASFAYANLTNPRKGYIDTMNPNMSVLYSTLVSTSQPMPPNGRLSNCDMDAITNWMKRGAKNN